MNMDTFYINQRILMKESDISRSIQISLTQEGARAFLNTVGLFETKDGRVIHTGLCKGSSDLIGWTHDGKFLAIEVKAPGGIKKTNKKRLDQQKNFINQVNLIGGVGFFADSVEDAVQQYKERTQ